MTATPAHSRLSPSGAYRWMRCPGSKREEAKYPERPSGPGAIDGTHSHTLLEHCVRNGLLDPMSMVGIPMSDHEGQFVVDPERAKRVAVAIEHVRTVSMNGLLPVIAEERVNPEHFLGRDDMIGTADIQIQRADLLEVIDYKDGMNEVVAKDNEQLELYALGALAKFKLPINVEYPFKHVRTTIIQPKLALRGLRPIVSHEMTVKEMIGLIPKYVAGAAATDRPDAPLTPGDKQCKYCAATGCSARAEAAMKAAGVAFPSIQQEAKMTEPSTPSFPAPPTIDIAPSVPDNPVEVGTDLAVPASQQVANQDTASMTPERLREILEAAPLMRQMIESAEAEALRRLESGQSIPGLKLVNGRGSRVWAIKDDEVAEKLKGMGVPKDAIFKTSVVSPAQAKKLTWTNRKGETKQLSERQVKTLETEYIVKLGGKLTVAPESDPRPAVVRDATALFSPVTQPQPAPTEAAPSLPSWLS